MGYFGLSLVVIAITIQLQGNVVAQWSQMYEDLKTCKGKPTGMSEYVPEALPLIAPCLTRTGKWCKGLCAVQRVGFINETGHFDRGKGRSVYLRTTKINNPTRDQLFQEFETCIGREVYEERGNCENVRKAIYCFYNKYYYRCKIKKAKKDLAVKSEETGLLNDAVDGVEILSTA